MRMKLTMAAASAALLGAAVLTTAGGASASPLLTFTLHDTDTGTTDILNTSGELTGGNSAVPATAGGSSFTAIGYFNINPNELLTNFDIVSHGTANIGEISGGTAAIYEDISSVWTLVPGTLINLQTAPSGVASVLTSSSSTVDLGPGAYRLVINSSGIDTLLGQGAAKFAVDLEGSAVPEPATWAMMILGVGLIGFAARRRRESAASFA